MVVSNEDGLPFVVPLGLPELPFANNGSHLLAPFTVGASGETDYPSLLN